jgi:tetratricopeptide (TPR) repeat protein
MKKPYILIITAVLCLALTGSMSLANDPDIETLKQAVEMHPNDADAQYNFGVAYHKSGMYKEAIESYKQAIRIDPDHANAHYSFAYKTSNDRDSALEQYVILKSLDPELANKLLNRIGE